MVRPKESRALMSIRSSFDGLLAKEEEECCQDLEALVLRLEVDPLLWLLKEVEPDVRRRSRLKWDFAPFRKALCRPGVSVKFIRWRGGLKQHLSVAERRTEGSFQVRNGRGGREGEGGSSRKGGGGKEGRKEVWLVD